MLKAVRDKLRLVDPSFKTAEDFNNYTSEYAKEVNNDVLAFLRQANETDQKLRDGVVPKGAQGIKKVD